MVNAMSDRMSKDEWAETLRRHQDTTLNAGERQVRASYLKQNAMDPATEASWNAWCKELIQRELKAHALQNKSMTIKIISGLIRKVLDHEREQHTKLCEDMRKEFSNELASLRKDIGIANGTVREIPSFLRKGLGE
jgi:hypothetical protein